ncbi:MAG: hypothetical protein LKJ57_01575 [Ancrocorticia sp.]|nr:hypothetical protein [Ancrocorticia sp.]MCI1895689.1 hypothetical protein [Ancrocorticia sp.]MCI1932231.1 hypothetical protein [Ancrocorticia sp.]MCI1963044.1 hypothetical protein [Ancrocorticia sp.]MCI2001412.1 hypothetical protein [Ancrocorticia sp.]
MKALVIIAIVALLGAYLFFSLRGLWRSAKRLGSTAESFATAAGAAFDAVEPRTPDSPLPPARARRSQARAALRRISNERRFARARRLQAARTRWATVTSHSFPRMDRHAARRNWDERRAARADEAIVS